ncbi:MAG: beta-propeller domain-containing protein [Nocardioides sp.]
MGNDSQPSPGATASWTPTTGTRVLTIDVSDPTRPTLTHTARYSSSLVAARQHGDVVRLVLSASLPDLPFTQPRWWRNDRRSLELNQEVVRHSTLDDWLPTVAFDGGAPTPAVDCSRVAIPEHDSGLGTLTVVGFSADQPTATSSTAVATASQTAYLSTDRLYLAASPWTVWGPCCWDGPMPAAPLQAEGVTRLYAFSLAGTQTTYVGSGEVRGNIADRWAMDAVDGTLRVAVGPTSATGSFNSVVTLAERGSELVEVGRVDRLGPDEQIKSVRWFDDLALVVTFRQTDPLYAVDLGDPARPRLLGALKVPGFSEYLHPIGDGRILGLGQDADPATGITRGAQVALFDVSDLGHPARLDAVRFARGTFALAGQDPRQFTWLPDRDTALTVVTDGWDSRTGWVSVLRVGSTGLTQRLVEVEYGADVARVRLVPLPSGEVALVTADSVSYLPI